MEAVIRAASVYVVLLVLFRLGGNRSLAQITTFDLVLLLITSEAMQNALVGQDYSLTTGVLTIVTLIGIDIALSLIKRRWTWVERWIEGNPLVLVRHGRVLQDRLDKERVDISDILSAARHQEGVGRMQDIRYAVLERSGGISVIPEER